MDYYFSSDYNIYCQYSYTRDTPALELMPTIQPTWYKNGLPATLVTKSAPLSGGLLDFVPVDLISKITEKQGALNFSKDILVKNVYMGYIDQKGIYHPKITKPIPYNNIKPGDRVATLFYRKGSVPWLEGCKVSGKGNWILLDDYGTIKAGASATKTVQYMQGVNLTNARNLSYTVGAQTTGNVRDITTKLSKDLSTTLSAPITITEEASVTNTVDFATENKDQRIGVYQFCRYYYIHPGPAFNSFSQKSSTDPKIKFTSVIGRSFNYPTKNLQKMSVTAP